jgi:arabinose-5-phosphate isomerase
MNYKEITQEVLITEANELLRTADKIGDEIERVVDIIDRAKGKLIVTGVGKSGLVGSKMAATFASTGTSSFFLHPTEAMHGDLGMIGSDDVVLGISYSGESEELVQILPHLKRFDIPLIAMTSNSDSSLASFANVTIGIGIEKEACPLNVAPTSSTTLTMALGDALAVCLMKKRNFQKEDFASFHPGGSLGKKLFIKVSDIIQKENLPLIQKGTNLKDAILKMSEGRVGTVIIVDEKGKLSGILSDGDLRRALLDDSFTLECSADKVATLNPKTINDKNILASDALAIIEKYKIQSLVVVNKEQEVEGLLHIHTLVEMGIK